MALTLHCILQYESRAHIKDRVAAGQRPCAVSMTCRWGGGFGEPSVACSAASTTLLFQRWERASAIIRIGGYKMAKRASKSAVIRINPEKQKTDSGGASEKATPPKPPADPKNHPR